RHAPIAPRTTVAPGPRAWDAPRIRTHRSIPAPPTPARASRLPRTVPYPTPALAVERLSPDRRARGPRSNRPGPSCSTRRTSLPRRSAGRRVPSNQASLPPVPAAATLPPSFRKSPGQEEGIGLSEVLDRVTMQVLVRDHCTMIAAPVQSDVDG